MKESTKESTTSLSQLHTLLGLEDVECFMQLMLEFLIKESNRAYCKLDGQTELRNYLEDLTYKRPPNHLLEIEVLFEWLIKILTTCKPDAAIVWTYPNMLIAVAEVYKIRLIREGIPQHTPKHPAYTLTYGQSTRSESLNIVEFIKHAVPVPVKPTEPSSAWAPNLWASDVPHDMWTKHAAGPLQGHPLMVQAYDGKTIKVGPGNGITFYKNRKQNYKVAFAGTLHKDHDDRELKLLLVPYIIFGDGKIFHPALKRSVAANSKIGWQEEFSMARVRQMNDVLGKDDLQERLNTFALPLAEECMENYCFTQTVSPARPASTVMHTMLVVLQQNNPLWRHRPAKEIAKGVANLVGAMPWVSTFDDSCYAAVVQTIVTEAKAYMNTVFEE
jgi:hypothetical protein